jgi:cysteinyl-tRNA synthetase
MTRKKELFLPVNPGKVSMYACGPTAHARMHVGEGRRFIFSDLLARYLAYRGYAVKQVMNITDLDDKTIEGSSRPACPWKTSPACTSMPFTRIFTPWASSRPTTIPRPASTPTIW